jgi:dienelactone hydrolase
MHWVQRIGFLSLIAGLTACSAKPASNPAPSATITEAATLPASTTIPVASATSSLSPTPQSSATPAPSETPAGFLASWGCTSKLPYSDISFSGPQVGKSYGTVLGDGDTGIVISNQSEGEICPWLPLAEALAKRHNRVLLYQYGSGDRADLVAAAAAFMAQQGVKSIILIGASQGAKASIVAVARGLPEVVALVSLSAEARLAGLDVEPYAKKNTLPVLFITADHDPYGSSQATPTFFKDAPVKDKQLIVLPGDAHGYDLLADSSVLSAVLKFVDDHQAASSSVGTAAPSEMASSSGQVLSTPPETPPALLASCTPPLTAQAVTFNTTQGSQLNGALIGKGDTGVVISNQSGNSVCQWTAFIPQLTQAGYEVLVYQYGTPNRVDDAEGAVTFLSGRGLKRIILLGGSQGAELTVITAGKNLPGVVAAVSLSADEYLRSVDAGSFAAQVKIPILFITAKDDPYGSMDTSTKFYSLAATPQSEKQLVVVPGSAHGYELLSDPALQSQVLKFMQDHR